MITVSQGPARLMIRCISGDNYPVVLLQMLTWIPLNNISDLSIIKERSFKKPQVLFKHSTRCGTSSLVKSRLERSIEVPDADFYFLDLIRNRDVSDTIAHLFNIYHESPQLLLIKNGECFYEESHLGIDMVELTEQIALLN